MIVSFTETEETKEEIRDTGMDNITALYPYGTCHCVYLIASIGLQPGSCPRAGSVSHSSCGLVSRNMNFAQFVK